VIVPSLWYENSPNVVLEAMAHGRPVVASDLGSLPEEVIDGETGLCFKPGNEEDLADQVKALLSDPATAAELGSAARKRVLAEHSMKGHLKMLKELFGRFA
jgi:glycosyltransferase involved in cell wall biosynthesis